MGSCISSMQLSLHYSTSPILHSTSGQDIFYNVSMDVRQPEIAALKTISEFFMIEPQQVHDGGLKIMDVDLIAHYGEAEFIRFSVAHAMFHTTACQENSETIRVVVTPQNLAGCGATF